MQDMVGLDSECIAINWKSFQHYTLAIWLVEHTFPSSAEMNNWASSFVELVAPQFGVVYK